MRYLQRRGGIWWIRRPIPKRLWPILNQRERLVSLKTGDERLAESRANATLPRIERELAEAERALTDPTLAARILARTIKDDEGNEVFDNHLIEKLEADERARGEAWDDETDAPIPREPSDRKMSDAERAATWALLKRHENRGPDGKPLPTLSEILEKFQIESQLSSREWGERQAMWQRFIDVVGDLPVKQVRRAHIRDFKDALLKMPRNKRKPDGQTLSGTTVKKYLAIIRSVLAWAVRNDYAESNPAADLRLAMRTTAEKPRVPYDVDALRTLFSSAFYTDPTSLPANSSWRGSRAAWWLPLLAIFTGARREELGQLHVADVREEDGVHYIHVRPGDGKKVKTRGSDRRIPVHPELVRLGFLEHVAAMRAAGHVRVFTELKPDPHGRLTDAFGKWFGRYCESIGIKSVKTCFHSNRHGWVDAAREVMPEEHRHAITGHTGGGVGRTYGRGVPLHVLAESMAKVRYRGLDLSALYLRP